MNNDTTAIINSPDRYATLSQFVQRHMKNGIDYGIIPGTQGKPALLKPGTEKLCRLFGLSASFQLIESRQDFTGKEYGEPLFYYWYKCSLHYSDQLIAESDGSCNSWEKKYRYRETKPACPICREAAIRKSQSEYYCWKKLNGCGGKFTLSDSRIAKQSRGSTQNTEIFDQINTLQKMAQKRALIGAVLIATGASEFFTQDLED